MKHYLPVAARYQHGHYEYPEQRSWSGRRDQHGRLYDSVQESDPEADAHDDERYHHSQDLDGVQLLLVLHVLHERSHEVLERHRRQRVEDGHVQTERMEKKWWLSAVKGIIEEEVNEGGTRDKNRRKDMSGVQYVTWRYLRRKERKTGSEEDINTTRGNMTVGKRNCLREKGM